MTMFELCHETVARLAVEEAADAALPCRQHGEADGIAACTAAGAWCTCPALGRACAEYGSNRSACPRAVADHRDRAPVVRRLRVVPQRYAEVILRAVPQHLPAGNPPALPPPPVPLVDTIALRVMQAVIGGHAGRVALAGGAHVDVRGDEWAIVLIGPTSRGKSGAAAWAISRVGGTWVTARDLARIGDEADQLRQKAEAADLLVVDDAGTEHAGATDYGPGEVARLLEARQDACRRTIVTSNLDPAGLRARYGERVVERLRERGVAVTCTGPNLRAATAPSLPANVFPLRAAATAGRRRDDDA